MDFFVVLRLSPSIRWPARLLDCSSPPCIISLIYMYLQFFIRDNQRLKKTDHHDCCPAKHNGREMVDLDSEYTCVMCPSPVTFIPYIVIKRILYNQKSIIF